MKACLICGHKSSADAFTCPRCGEASWSKAVAAKPTPSSPPAAPVPDQKPYPEPSSEEAAAEVLPGERPKRRRGGAR